MLTKMSFIFLNQVRLQNLLINNAAKKNNKKTKKKRIPFPLHLIYFVHTSTQDHFMHHVLTETAHKMVSMAKINQKINRNNQKKNVF